MTSSEKMQLRFMESAIERINLCLMHIHALESLSIKKGLFTEKELADEVNDARMLPQTSVGKKALLDMIQDFNFEKLSNPSSTDSACHVPSMKSSFEKST